MTLFIYTNAIPITTNFKQKCIKKLINYLNFLQIIIINIHQFNWWYLIYPIRVYYWLHPHGCFFYQPIAFITLATLKRVFVFLNTSFILNHIFSFLFSYIFSNYLLMYLHNILLPKMTFVHICILN